MSTDVATTPETEEPRCTKCSLSKPLAEFFIHKSGKYAGEPRSWCKSCHVSCCVERMKLRRASEEGYKDGERSKARRLRFKKKYDMTPEDYEAVLEWQGGGCAVCQTETNVKVGGIEKLFAVDHDHSTGKIRGLLCDPCNRGIGLLKDNSRILRDAADYLDRNSG